MLLITLIRHPETMASLQGRFPNGLEEYSPEGKKQFSLLLKTSPNGKLVTSDMPRCLRIAKMLSNTYCIPLTVDPRIREIDMGDFHGHTFSELEKKYPEEVKRWMEDPLLFTYPNGESFEQFQRRVEEFLLALNDPEYTFITHYGVIHVIVRMWMGIDLTSGLFPCAQKKTFERVHEGTWLLKE